MHNRFFKSVLMVVVIQCAAPVSASSVFEPKQTSSFQGTINFAVGASRQGRPPSRVGQRCEDVLRVEPISKMPFFGLFDGNGGHASAEVASETLYENLMAICGGDDTVSVSDDKIARAFELTSNTIDQIKRNRSGSTAVIAFFSYEKISDMNILHVAHIGDSLALLGVMGESIEAQALTKPHRPSNDDEKQRIASLRKRKPEISVGDEQQDRKYLRGMDRDVVEVDLVPLTQQCAKENIAPQALPASLDMMVEMRVVAPKDKSDWERRTGLAITRSFGHSNLRSKGLITKPEILNQPILPAHKFLILASDGVLDHVTNDEAISFVWERLSIGEEPEEVAKKLMLMAAQKDMRNPFRGDNEFATVKLGLKDDMAVIIVVLNPALN